MKTSQAEEILDQFLNMGSHIIGSKEEENVIALIHKMPSDVNEQKLLDALLKMGASKLFRYVNSFPEAYIPVLRQAMSPFLRDPYVSKMMMQCVVFALDRNFSETGAYKDFCDIGKLLQYLDKLQLPVEKPEQLAKADQFLTPAVGEAIAYALMAERYTSRDIRAFNTLIYLLAKSNLPAVESVVKFQMGGGNSMYELNVLINMLKPNKDLPNTAKGYQLVYDRLYTIQSESLAFQFASSFGLEPDLDLKWNIKIQVSSDPNEKTPRNGWFVTTEVSNQWNDCIQLIVKGPKGMEKGNERHGVLRGKGLDFRKIDLFNLRPEMDEIGQLYGIEKLYWENADVSVKGFEKSTAKLIKKLILK